MSTPDTAAYTVPDALPELLEAILLVNIQRQLIQHAQHAHRLLLHEHDEPVP